MIKGPWPCEECKQLTQYADTKKGINYIYCKNESCGYKRIVDKRRSQVVENDGTVWAYDHYGVKRRVRARA